MPWDREDEWDHELLGWYTRCIGLRRASDALATGSLRWVHVGADSVAYLRETAHERLLCCATRRNGTAIQVPAIDLDCERITTLIGGNVTVVDGRVVLPAEGPAFHVWRLSGSPAGEERGSTPVNESSTEVARG
jgi:alpha-glucosidase